MLYKQIILEWGQDTESGVWGLGYSPDNGKNFYVLNTTHGRKYRAEDGNRLYPYISDQVQDKIDTVVAPAKSAANSAVAYANDAVEKSRVNSQAIDDINSAVSDAVSDAAVARSDGLRALNAAQSNVNLIDLNYASASAAISSARTEAIAAADEAKTSASAAQAGVVAVKSDIAAAKSDIADTRTSLTSQAKSLSSYAEQASAAGKDITTLKSQAGQFEQDMASVKGDVSQLKVSASSASVTLADAAGNISSLQATAKSYSAALSDTNSNVASVTATARELETKYADAAGDINKLQTDAKGTTQTLNDAQGDIAKLKTRADGFDTKYADAAGDINTLKANASGFSQTLVSAKGDISTLQETATGFKNTLTDAQGNISTLQSDVSGLKKTTSDNAGNIATLQASAKTLTSQMSSAQGDISTLKQTASDFSSKVSGMATSLSDANSKLSAIQANGGGTNLIAQSDLKGGYLNSNNGEVSYVGIYDFHVESYIPTNGSTEFTFSSPDYVFKGSSNCCLAMYDSDKKYLGSQNITTATQTLSNPNTAYIRFSINFVQEGGTAGELSDWLSTHRYMFEKGIIAHDWSPSPEDVDAKITANTTAIGQNKQAIALKADQTTVDKTNGDIQQLQSQLKVQAGQIASKVSSSDIDAKGYATQTYTQTQIKQTSDTWNANLTSIKDGMMQSYSNLHATVDGIQAQVYNSDGTSKITQLSTVVQSKVSQGDYNSQINQLKSDINLRVQKGDVVSQINEEAGGNTLIQVSNGKGSLILDADNTIVTGKEWIPVASIADLTADQIQAGTLTGSTIHLDDNSGNTIDLGGLATNYVGFHSKATNGDQTYIDHNGIHNYGSSYDTKISQGKITTNLLAVNGGGLIDFRSGGSGATLSNQELQFYNSNSVNGGLSFSGSVPIAPATDGASGNELRIRYDRSFAVTPISDDSARICASPAVMQLGFVQSGSSTPDKNTTGLWVDSNNRRINLGVWGADSTWARMETTTHNINLQANDAHAWLSGNDNLFHIYRDNDGGSATATKLQVDGWAWVRGWVEAAGHSQHSALSTKTALQAIDDDEMLEMVNDTDLASFLFETDVASGETHRHIGLIIDDVHDVARYQTPQDFIAPNGVSRDDDNMIGALFGAVKALTKRIKTLESKVG